MSSYFSFPSWDETKSYLSQFGYDPTQDFYTPTMGYLPSQAMRVVDTLFGSGKSLVDKIASEAYRSEPVWNPEAGMPTMRTRPGLENMAPMSTGTMLREAIAPKPLTSDVPFEDPIEEGLYGMGRAGLTLAGDLALDPALYALGGGGALSKALGGYFGAKGAIGAGEKTAEALNAPDLTSAFEPGAEALGYAALGYLGARGAAKGTVPSPFNKELVWRAPDRAIPESPVRSLAPAGGFMVKPGSIVPFEKKVPKETIDPLEAQVNNILGAEGVRLAPEFLGLDNATRARLAEKSSADLVDELKTFPDTGDRFDTEYKGYITQLLNERASRNADILSFPVKGGIEPTIGETLRRPREPYHTVAEHGTAYPSWYERGLSPRPTTPNALGEGFYASQDPGNAAGYARVHGAGPRVERVGDKYLEVPYKPTVLKGDVSAEKPLFLDEPAPNDLRMKALVELNRTRQRGEIGDWIEEQKAKILDPNSTSQEVAQIGADFAHRNMPLEARRDYTGDALSDIIKSAGYDLWQTGRRGEPATEIIVPDPRRQFKIGEVYPAIGESRPVLADTSGEPVPPIRSGVTRDTVSEKALAKISDAGLQRLRRNMPEDTASRREVDAEIAKRSGNQSLANPSVRISEPPPIEPSSQYLELAPLAEDFAAKVDKTARALGYKDIPTGSKMAQEGVVPLSENAIALRDLLKATKSTRFTPATLIKSLADKGFDPTDLAKSLPDLLAELTQAGYLNKKATGTYTFSAAPLRGAILPSKPVHPMGTEGISLEDALKGTSKLIKEGVGLEDINAIKKGIVEKPISEMGSQPVKPSKAESVPVEGEPDIEMGEEGKPGLFTVELSDGSSHVIKARSPEDAQVKAEKVLAQYGSTKTVDKVTPKLSSLEQAAQHEIEPVKAGAELGAEELGSIKRVQTLEEKAHERELKGQLKIEQDFQKAEEKRRVKLAKAEEKKLKGATEKIGWMQSPVAQVLNSIKSIAYGGDVGHLLNQGKQLNVNLLLTGKFKEFKAQFPILAKFVKSEKFFEDFHNKLYEDPTIKRMVDTFGLDLPGLGKGLKEEVFHGGGLAEKAPIIGKYYAKPSERVYTGGLNYLRATETKRLVSGLEKRGFTMENAPQKYHAIARAVNIIGRRGDFSPAYQKVFSDFSTIYGAPRNKAARWQNALELFRAGTSGNIVRASAARSLAFNAGMLGVLYAAFPGKVQFIADPERSDFLKIRIGDKFSIDPWIGLGVTARTTAKIITGKAVSPYTGKEYPVSASDAIANEFLGGIAPGIKLFYELARGQDIRGFEVDRRKAILNAAPLTGRQIYDMLSSGNLEEAFLLSVLQAAGESTDVFDYEKAREEQDRLKIERGKPIPRKSSSKKVIYAF